MLKSFALTQEGELMCENLLKYFFELSFWLCIWSTFTLIC